MKCDLTQESDSCAALSPHSHCAESDNGPVCLCVAGYTNIDSVCKGMIFFVSYFKRPVNCRKKHFILLNHFTILPRFSSSNSDNIIYS